MRTIASAGHICISSPVNSTEDRWRGPDYRQGLGAFREHMNIIPYLASEQQRSVGPVIVASEPK